MKNDAIVVKEQENYNITDPNTTNSSQLNGITVVYLIAIGFQIFVLLFIFAKRQIMRFAWSSRREPHAPLGFGGSKELKDRILGNMQVSSILEFNPQLDASEFSDESLRLRIKCVSQVQRLYEALEEAYSGKKCSGEKCFVLLKSLDQSLGLDITEAEMAKVAVLYESARHLPSVGVFIEERFYETLKLKGITEEEAAELDRYCEHIQTQLRRRGTGGQKQNGS